ncbi:MAG: hypothetical protein F9K24_17995 [Leptonema illini]|uniref:Deacetylase sirtuin-type domain-containing protein n=1 Tax=Leptonema illini TaxID=183 RepID=A0A833M006_9LEPT|nr:MAG: hypothetical protein F9K24_17995 [Leptonema illini]
MIEPLHSLAFSVQSNPGVFAVLLGSGVSRAANIPTGWEITLDLVRKLASINGESIGTDPILWYREKYGKEPDYSDLLDALAKTQAERQQLLRPYFEPDEDDREQGWKEPTTAHRAIAELVVSGHIRVIITTNFDRLMETALADAGVVPTVLSSPDQVIGAMPLIHTSCVVFKVHGDYLDTRIRNTPTELAQYPPEFNSLLDRIFDEFGLIACGWSAEWDQALRSAMERAVSRRFSHFWALYSSPGDAASRLIAHRQASTILNTDADQFFSELQRLVNALTQFSRPHPLSKEAAIASLKQYLTDERHRIRLADLINGEVDRMIEATSGPEFAVSGSDAPDRITFTTRVRAYEAACETLLAMAAIGGYWIEDWHYEIWQRALTRLAIRRADSGYNYWIDLQLYPATLLMYALGLGAVSSGERGLHFLGDLLKTTIHRQYQELTTAVELLPANELFDISAMQHFLEGMEKRYAPLNDWIQNSLKPHFHAFHSTEAESDGAFDKLEILIGLSFGYQTKPSPYRALPGCYGYRYRNRQSIIGEIRNSIDSQLDDSPFVKSGIFGKSAAECAGALNSFTEWAKCFARWS